MDTDFSDFWSCIGSRRRTTLARWRQQWRIPVVTLAIGLQSVACPRRPPLVRASLQCARQRIGRGCSFLAFPFINSFAARLNLHTALRVDLNLSPEHMKFRKLQSEISVMLDSVGSLARDVWGTSRQGWAVCDSEHRAAPPAGWQRRSFLSSLFLPSSSLVTCRTRRMNGRAPQQLHHLRLCREKRAGEVMLVGIASNKLPNRHML